MSNIFLEVSIAIGLVCFFLGFVALKVKPVIVRGLFILLSPYLLSSKIYKCLSLREGDSWYQILLFYQLASLIF